MQRDQLIPLVRKRRARLLEVGHYLLTAVVHVPDRDDLVAGVVEGAERGVEVVLVLRLHVFAHHGLAPFAQRVHGAGA